MFNTNGFIQKQGLYPEQSPYVSNTLIIKLNTPVLFKPDNNRFNLKALDDLLASHGNYKLEKVFPYVQDYPGGIESITLHTGQVLDLPDLRNTYKVTFDSLIELDVWETIREIEQDVSQEIDYVEPNYYSFSADYNPNDSLYANQWNKSKIKADTIQLRFNTNTGITDTNIVIAILDTGIDTLHPDIKNKLYYNQSEKNGLPGVDDDQNGYVDDIFGWDVINDDGIAFDDNSHGTHCAGIAAAETNNSIGIAGISEGAKLMPVKILQSNGYGGNDDVAEGIVYAANNGADVISMSFGSYARSNLQENALAYAYAFSFLVAAAGNDGKCIGPGIMCKPAYPAAYSFVLGVQATKPYKDFNGWLAQWSNFDQDGPFYSGYDDLLNYEVQAPGAGIISTIPLGNFSSPAPNGRYAFYSGTSMATPAVAGAVALMKAYNSNWTNDELFIRLIRSWYNPYGYFIKSPQYPYEDVDILQAIDVAPSPFTVAVGLEIVDTLNGCDNDGVADAGENVIIKVRYRNFGNTSDSLIARLGYNEFEDPSVGTWIDHYDTINSIAPYGEAYGYFQFEVDSSVVNNRTISLLSKTIEIGETDTVFEGLNFSVENGVEVLPGYYSGTVIFKPSINYIVKGNIYADTLIIKPGAIVSMNPGVTLSFNYITCKGTKDSIITFTRASVGYWTGFTNMNNDVNYHPEIEYTKIEFFNNNGLILNGYINNGFVFRNCIFENGNGNIGIWGSNDGESVTADKCVFLNLYPESHSSSVRVLQGSNFTNNVVGGNKITFTTAPIVYLAYSNSSGTVTPVNFKNNAFINNKSSYFGTAHIGPMGGAAYMPVSYLRANYFGYTNSNRINSTVIDMIENPNVPAVMMAADSALSSPTSDCHGVLVDVKINGISINKYDNPYDGSNGLGSLGNGKHTVSVVFNREMDTTRSPFVTFGGRYPYTTHIVSDSARWDSTGQIWMANLTVSTARSMGGINRLSVRNYFDNEFFPGPTDDERFEFRIDNSGALSNKFIVVPDTGFISSEWGKPEDLDDILGYNLYRIDSTHVVDTNKAPSQLNTTLMQDSAYNDSAVLGGVYYGYYFNVTRTNLTPTQNSDTLWARAWQGKPSAITTTVVNRTHNSVTLNGKANPNYLATDVRFNYGTSTNYTTNTIWQSIGNGSEFVTKSVNLSGLTPGQTYHYRIEAKNAEGTSYGKDSTFTMKDFPTLAYTYDSTLCVGDTFTITNSSTISTGTLSYTWQVRNASGSLVHTSTDVNPTFTMASAGVYTIKLTASSSDAVTTTKTTGLVVEAIPTPSISAGGATTFCQGGSVTLTGNTGYQSYMWSNNATSSSITVSDSNEYTLTVTSANGCAGSTSITVDVNPLPTATVVSATGDYDFCDGSSLTLEAPTGAAGYQWYKDGSAITGGTSSTLSATSSGSYAVQVTSSDGCSSLSSAQTVTKNALPTASISAGSSLSFCDGGSVTLSAPSGMSYAWTTGSTTQSVTLSSSGQVGLTITDANGCSTTATPVTVNVYSVPTLTVTAASSTSICQGQSVTLQASGGFSSYAWSNGATNQNLIATTAGSYSVTGTTSDGCTASSVAQSVVVNPNPVSTVTNSGNSVLCSGASTTLTAPAGMNGYTWSTGDTTQSIVVSSAGSYTVTVVNAGGCSATSAATVISTSQIAAPTISVSGPLAFCAGGSVTLGVPMGYSSYSWNSGAISTQLVATQGGDYYATVTNSDGCTASSDTVSVVVFATPPTPSIGYTANDTIMISSIADGNQWYFNGNILQGETNDTLRPLNFGNYSVRVVDTNGCEGGMSAMQFYNSVGIAEDLERMIKLYPNPTQGLVTLDLGLIEVCTLRIFDAQGRMLVEQSSCTGQCQFDLSEYRSGIYRLLITINEGQVLTKSIVLTD